jgi:hypothetical protein
MTHLDQFQSLDRLRREEEIQWIECEGCQEDCDNCSLLKIINNEEVVT